MGRARHLNATLLLLAAGSLPLAGCGRFNARMELKEGNKLYKEGKYDRALEHYELVPTGYPERVQGALYAGYSHMAQYKTGSRHAKDLEHAERAIQAFQEYMTIRPTDSKDLPDDAKVHEWIVTLLVNTERFDEAIAELEEQLKLHPDDPAILRVIADVYDKQGKRALTVEYFDKWAQLFPADPAPQVAISAYCWNVSYRSGAIIEPEARNRWVDRGLMAAHKALQIEPEHFEGLTYQNLLLRERAKLRTDPDTVARLLDEARVLLEKATAIRRKQKEAEEAAKAKSAQPEGSKPAANAT